MGYFDNALGKLRDSAIDFIRQRVKDEETHNITLDPRIIVNVEVGDVGMPTFDGVEKWSIYAVRWDDETEDVFFDICAGDQALDNPDPLTFEQLDTADVIALADLLDTRAYKENEKHEGAVG